MTRWLAKAGAITGVVIALAAAPAPVSSQPAPRILVEPDPSGRMVAVAIAFPSGHSHDPSGSEGTAFLLGQILEAEGNRRLTERNATLRVEVEPERIVLTLLVPQDEWEGAMRELRSLLSETRFPEALVEEMRARLQRRLLFESGAPVRAFQREKANLLHGAGHPAARPADGTLSSVARLDATVLSRFLGDRLDLGASTIALTGPVTRSEVERVIGATAIEVRTRSAAPVRRPAAEPRAPDRGAPVPTPPDPDAANPEPPPGAADTIPAPEMRLWAITVPAFRVPEASVTPPAWREPQRTVIDEDLTSVWIGVAYPIPPGTPAPLSEFTAHLVTEELNPSPPSPGIYSAGARIETVLGVPVLIVTATVDPRTGGQWEERILSAVQELGESPPDGAFFELTRRRFRTDRLLGLSIPEARVRWLIREATVDGIIPDPEEDAWRLDQQGVRDLVTSLGPPRILLYGPVSMMRR